MCQLWRVAACTPEEEISSGRCGCVVVGIAKMLCFYSRFVLRGERYSRRCGGLWRKGGAKNARCFSTKHICKPEPLKIDKIDLRRREREPAEKRKRKGRKRKEGRRGNAVGGEKHRRETFFSFFQKSLFSLSNWFVFACRAMSTP